jgi:hypothetical protein
MCGGICAISSQILSGPAPLSHHITTHPKGILAEVAGMAEMSGSGSLTFAAVRLHIQNSKNTVTAPSASHAVKNNRQEVHIDHLLPSKPGGRVSGTCFITVARL